MNKQLAASNSNDPSANPSQRVSLRDLATVSFPAIPVPSALPEGVASLVPPAVPLSVASHAEGGMRISRYAVDVAGVPVDFFADPDGVWDFDSLVESAGFEPENPGVCIGALISAYDGHPVGSAVVTEVGRARSYVAIVECPLAEAKGEPLTAPESIRRGAESSVTRAA